MPTSCPSLTKAKLLEPIKHGRRLYGGIYETPDGRKVYLAFRQRKEIFRSGKATISDAVRDGVADWAIDDATLIRVRAKGVHFVGVLMKDDGAIWLTRLGHFFDRTKASVKNYSGRGGALQRYLPLRHFAHKPGRITL